MSLKDRTGHFLGWRVLLPALLLLVFPAAAFAQDATPTLDSGDTAWMLTSTVLVFLMILPGLALFYGGLVRAKNVLSVLTQVLGVTSVAILVWVLWGYTLAFGGGEGQYFGDTDKLFLKGITGDTLSGTIPELVFIAFQMTFAAITASLVVGSLVERVKFSAILVFALLWLTIVYAPIAHMVWAPSGLIMGLGALDFAGGTVVHINSGIAGLVGALIVGKRLGFLKEPLPPHSLPLTLVGACLLWGGWFGFNAGSALAAGGGAAIPLVNTFICPAAAVLTWLLAEKVVSGKASLLGGASGAIAGLVAITPAAGTSGFVGAIFLGIAASLACYIFVGFLKHRFKLDDSLDVFGIHGVGGIVGSIGTGIVAAPALGGFGAEDLVISTQLWIQVQAVAIAIAWSATGSAIIWLALKFTLGLRVPADAEREGLDITDHGERAYNY